MAVIEGKFKQEESLNRKVLIIYKSGKEIIVDAEYFGVAEGVAEFIGFWRHGDEYPKITVAKDVVETIEMLDDSQDLQSDKEEKEQ